MNIARGDQRGGDQRGHPSIPRPTACLSMDRWPRDGALVDGWVAPRPVAFDYPTTPKLRYLDDPMEILADCVLRIRLGYDESEDDWKDPYFTGGPPDDPPPIYEGLWKFFKEYPPFSDDMESFKERCKQFLEGGPPPQNPFDTPYGDWLKERF